MNKLLFLGVGLAAGILLAPKKGADTRQDIKEFILEKAEFLQDKFEERKNKKADFFAFETDIEEVEEEYQELKKELDQKLNN